MQRYLVLVVMFLCSLPVGLSVAGCRGTNPNNYCNGAGYGNKLGVVTSINLEPKTTGISLAYGQTAQLPRPTASDCKGSLISLPGYTYGSQNIKLADIDPVNGVICAGRWNRNSASGIPDFTICTPPPGPGTATVTATGAAVVSNPVTVYVHPPISAITIPDPALPGPGGTPPLGCVSQNQQLRDAKGNVLPLTAETTVLDNSGNPIDPRYVGNITFGAVTPNIVSISQTTGTNGVATAEQPGSTVITATLSQVTSAAGYFYTCPPASINLAVNGNNAVTVRPGSPQNISTTVTDSKGVSLAGVVLDYSSTQPTQAPVSSLGQISSIFPTTAAITAICQPGTCNPAPVNKIGVLGNGLPVVANLINATSTGRSSTRLWMASPQSQFFTPIDLSNGNVGTPVKLPYTPNSMVMDQNGLNIYMGSYRELMTVSTGTNGLSKEDVNVPGVVLAVSPDGGTVVINDQIRKVIYLYTPANGSFTSIGGLATRAAFSPDGKNLYIVGPAALYVHNAQTGWSTYDISATQPGRSCTLDNTSAQPFCSPDIAVTIPAAGQFISGTTTTARSFCPNASATPPYYPPAGSVPAATDHVTATVDGRHILGANAAGQLSDIQFSTTGQDPGIAFAGPCPGYNGPPLQFQTTLNQLVLSGISPTAIDQVLASQDSTIAFVTYSGANANGVLPAYKLSGSAGAAGTLQNIQLSGSAGAPLAGIFSPDNTTFFVGTSGDNLVHFINVLTLTETRTIDPRLVDPSGKPVPVQFFVTKARPTT